MSLTMGHNLNIYSVWLKAGNIDSREPRIRDHRVELLINYVNSRAT